MKKTITTLLLILSVAGAQAAGGRRAVRHEQRQERAKQDSLRHRDALRALEDRSFIVRYTPNKSEMWPVWGERYFLILDHDKLKIQGFVGMEADVMSIKKKKGRKGRMNYRLELSSTGNVLKRVGISLDPGGNMATVMIHVNQGNSIYVGKLPMRPLDLKDYCIQWDGVLSPLEGEEIIWRKPLHGELLATPEIPFYTVRP